MNVETSNVKIPSQKEEVFHESFESFQEESSSSSMNDDVQQIPEEVILPQTNTQSISNDMIPNVDEASTSHNVFDERLEDAYFYTTLRDDDQTAFLNQNLKEEVYVGQPLGIVSKQYPDHVYALEKALYGLKQVPRIQVTQKKVKIAFENAYSSSRFELIPSKIKCAKKVVLNFYKEFSVFSSFKEIKITIIPPRQLFVNISYDEDVTTTPSPITTSSSPSLPNAQSKTSSTKDTSSTFGTTPSSFESKPQYSPPASNDTPSPQPSNPFLENFMDAPPRPSHPLPLQSHPSLDITLSLSPITLLITFLIHHHHLHHHHNLNHLSWVTLFTSTIIGEKVKETYTRLKILLNELENKDVRILKLNLAIVFGKYNYEEELIDQINVYKTKRFTIQSSTSKALVSNTYTHDSDLDVEEDTKSNSEFLVDLNAEFHDKGLLVN
nr:reverse transcriptase [Tanacetum cinerariifolium]